MLRHLKLMWLWWRTRKWNPSDHDMCLSFMGPCIGAGSCTERLEYVRLKNNHVTPEARLISRKWTPRKRRVHTIKTCQDIGWCHEVDDIRPPCCEECLAFGPCTECTDDLEARQAAATEICGLRCGKFDTKVGIDMVCTKPWVGPERKAS